MMSRRTTVIAAGLLLTLTLPFMDSGRVHGQAQTPATPRRMNVVFIIADDFNITLGSYGNKVIKTPNIDRLAARGVQFNRAYCQYPLCNPSRASLLSGRRPETTRVFGNDASPRQMMPDAVFMPQYFRQQGYFTARVGKIFHASRFLVNGKNSNDFTDPASFDVSISEVEALTNPQLIKAAERPEVLGTLEWHAYDVPDEDMGDGIVARRTVGLLEERAKDGKPFFIASGFRKPHLPWDAPRKYFDMYPLDQMPLAFSPANDLDDIPPVALTRVMKLSDAQTREYVRAYYASTSFMDAQVGHVLAALDRLKLWDSTIVVFVGDHGYHLGEHQGLWQKMTVFEECAQAPMIIAAPGARRGVVTSSLVEFVDIYPTLTDICALPQPEKLEGTSFRPLLADPTRPWKKAAFTSIYRGRTPGRSVRTARYRYTEWGEERTAELYDHENDPQEFTNLVNDPKHAPVVTEMRQVLKEGWQAALPMTSPGDATKKETRQ